MPPNLLYPYHNDFLIVDREGNSPAKSSTITYAQLLARVERFANVLKSKGAET
jgi:hypothetical protein